MGQHDDYGKLILLRDAGYGWKNDPACAITSYGDSCARIDGTVGSSIAVEIESCTGRQVRGAILDLILHADQPKLLILVPMYIGRHQVKECEFILKRFVEPNDFRVVLSLLFGVSSRDPWTYAGTIACVVAVSWLACYLPSRRAATVDPFNTLRAE
ncbi:MAG: hypothetical protein WB869_16915 [Candidatus Acidiferrales bacterium]